MDGPSTKKLLLLDGSVSGHTERMVSSAAESTENGVNFDGSSLVEVTVGGTDYRIDSGKQGTAFSISSRPTGTWDWAFGGEARWDGTMLRSRAFERPTLLELSSALSRALAELE
jgi:hypothetical protein